MKNIIEELRNANMELSELETKRDELRKKLVEHRSKISAEEFESIKAEKSKLDAAISEKKAVRDKLSEIAEAEEKREGGRTPHMFDEKELRNIDILRYDLSAYENREMRAAFEQRAAAFKKDRRMKISGSEIVDALKSERRSILSTSKGIAKPTRVGGIVNPFNQNITIFDQVDVQDMSGAGAYKVSFVKNVSVATAKTEGTAQTESSPTFGAVTISPQNIAVTSYISREVEKVTPLNYLEKVTENALVALKVKLSQDIVTKVKTGTDDDSEAMYQSLEASTANGLLSGTNGQINEKTLRLLSMSYGGDANVYGNAVLYLNKQDLIAFGDVRGTNNKLPVYKITPNAQNPNIGIIEDGGLAVPYCIVPTLTAHHGTAQTTAAVQTMVYGSPLNFQEAIFGDFGVRVSEEYKFAEGLLTVMGEIMAGGSVVVKNGFIVVTIPKTGA